MIGDSIMVSASMIAAFYIGLTTIALLSLWDSYLLGPPVSYIKRGVSRLGYVPLIYFIDCHYCKGFWMCFAGAAVAGNLWLTFPSYGIVVIGLALQGEHQMEGE